MDFDKPTCLPIQLEESEACQTVGISLRESGKWMLEQHRGRHNQDISEPAKKLVKFKYKDFRRQMTKNSKCHPQIQTSPLMDRP